VEDRSNGTVKHEKACSRPDLRHIASRNFVCDHAGLLQPAVPFSASQKSVADSHLPLE